jgi:addiction module HigA family antidote
MRPLDLSINALARELYVPVTRVSELVNERRSISADTALRLGRYFDTTPDFWVNLQTKYDLEIASRESGKAIEDRVKPRHAAA